MHDLGQGHVSMTDESVFDGGPEDRGDDRRSLWCCDDALFQLLECAKPLTASECTRRLA
jgi:hypothetical protein